MSNCRGQAAVQVAERDARLAVQRCELVEAAVSAAQLDGEVTIQAARGGRLDERGKHAEAIARRVTGATCRPMARLHRGIGRQRSHAGGLLGARAALLILDSQ